MKGLIPIALLSLTLGLSVRNVTPQTGRPFGQCRVGHEAPPIGFWTWEANAHVKVFVTSADFTTDEIPYLQKSLVNWNTVSDRAGSGVKFEYQGTTVRQATCDNCLTVMRGVVFDKTRRHATELRAFSARNNQIITYAAIVIDRGLTNPKAMLNAMVHELGHNLGLLDCYTCEKKSTVMNQFDAFNVPNDMEEPTNCDVGRVKAAYQALKVRVRPSPHSLDTDEGEEPVEDDTPIVIPKPPRG